MYTLLQFENPKEEGNFRRPRSRWEYKNKMDLKEPMYEGLIWIHLAQARVQ
jgi:hypothetical protein